MASCCVEGCTNIMSHPNRSISFHLFPRNKELKKKWLKMIWRPNWNPPEGAHVCSAHFSQHQMVQVNNSLWTIKADAYPDIAFPIKGISKTIHASDVEVCRMCLATDIKMFSVKNEMLKTCIDTIAFLHQNLDAEGLPQFVCYLCAEYLLRTNVFIEKCMIAQATLLEIHAENLEITKSLVKEQDRHKLNLVHSLDYNTQPMDVIEYVYDDNLKVSVLTNGKSHVTEKSNINNNDNDNIRKQTTTRKRSLEDISSEINLKDANLNMLLKKLKRDINNSAEFLRDTAEESLYDNSSTKNDDDDVVESKRNQNKIVNKDSDSVKQEGFKASKDDTKNDSEDSDNDTISCVDDDFIKKEEIFPSEQDSSSDDDLNESQRHNKENNKKDGSNTIRALSSVPKNVVVKKESLPHQPNRLKKQNIETKREENTEKEDGLRKEKIDECFSKVELTLAEQKKEWNMKNKSKYIASGTVECYKCSQQFVSSVALVNHLAGHNPDIGDSECRVCKLRYANDTLLNRHIKIKHLYKYYCRYCPYVFNNEQSALMHRRVHVIMSKDKHKCKTCGVIFKNEANLKAHIKRSHSTFTCELCSVTLPTIDKIRAHIREVHLANQSGKVMAKNRLPERERREPVVASTNKAHAVCETCGKSIQTSSSSQHDGNIPMRCEQCNKIFLDKTSSQKQSKDKLSQSEDIGEHNYCKPKPKSSPVIRDGGKPTKGVDKEIILTNETLYKCPTCDEMFRHSTSLEMHVQNVHLKLSDLKNVSIKNEPNEDISDTETKADVTEEYLELEDDIDDSNFKFVKIDHVIIKDPLVIDTSENSGKKKSKSIIKSNEKKCLELRDKGNSNIDNTDTDYEEYEEIESIHDDFITEEKDSQESNGVENENGIIKDKVEAVTDADEIVLNQNKEYVDEEYLEDEDMYEDLEVLEIDELEDNIES